MRGLVAFFFLIFPAGIGQAESETDFGFPDPISVSTQRELFKEAFPKRDTSVKKLERLIRYRKELELYRINSLGSFNEKIEDICVELKNVERKVNEEFRKGDMSQNEKERYDLRIDEERRNCDSKHSKTSRYYKVYRDFLSLYRNEAENAKEELNRCYASDPCRLGQI